MNMKLSKQNLQEAIKLMANSNKENLAKNVKSTNDLIIKALYYANLDYSYTADFISNNLNFYAPFHIQEDLKSKQLQDCDVKRWIGFVNIVISRAKKLCDKSAKEAREFNLN